MARIQADLHVATDGDDCGPGSEEKPFATLARAREAVRELKRTRKGPMTVLVHKGTYYQCEPLVFGPEDSGTADAPITYAARGGEKPVLSGGVPISGNWTPYRDGIMQTKVDLSAFAKASADQLFVNGERKHRARYPNYDANDPSRFGKGMLTMAGNTRGDNFVLVEALYDKQTFRTDRTWAHPEEAVLHCSLGTPVGNTIWQLKGIDTARGAFLLDRGGWHWNSRIFKGVGDMTGGQFYVENVFEELDAPGEWYLDARESVLYYMPEEGEDMAAAVVEAGLLTQVVEFRGSQDRPVRHVTLRGFQIAHTATVFLEPWHAPSMGDWTIHRSGAVFVQGAEDCRVEDCFFHANGGNAVFLDGYNLRCGVSGCTFSEAGESGVCLVGYNMGRLGSARPFPAECAVHNNHMHHLGVYGKQTAGVFLSCCERNVVSHNEIHHLPRAAICINDGTWGGQIIEHNWLYETCLESVDHGPFNSWGRGRHWCYNQSHGPDFPSHPAGNYADDVYYTTEIRHNRVEDDEWGIDMDDGTYDYHIHHNLCIGCPIKFREGDKRTIENNIIVDSGHSIVFNMGYEYTSDRFVRNVISLRSECEHDHNYGVSKEGRHGVFYHGIDTPLAGPLAAEIDHNCFWSDTGEFLACFKLGALGKRTGEKNEVLTLDQWRALGYDRNSTFADPLFTDPESGDYRVRPDSPALKLGFENFPMDRFGLLPDFPRHWEQ